MAFKERVNRWWAVDRDSPAPGLDEIRLKLQPRFGGGLLAVLFVAGTIAIGVALTKLLNSANFWDNTGDEISTTTTNAAGETVTTKTTESLFLLGPARFAIVVLLGFGLVLILAGILLGMAEMTKPTGTVRVPEDSLAATEATGLPAVLAAVAAALKEFASALKDVKPAVAAMALGATLSVFGGAIAWQTIPGTDKNATFAGTPAPTTECPTSSSDPSTSEPSTSGPSTSDPSTSEPARPGDSTPETAGAQMPAMAPPESTSTQTTEPGDTTGPTTAPPTTVACE